MTTPHHTGAQDDQAQLQQNSH